MPSTLPALIDKQDGFEVLRDQIALILFENQTAQQALAVTAGKDPALWKLRVYTERANPWEEFLNAPADTPPDTSPIVHVWFESGSFDEAKSGAVDRQTHTAVFNVDVYGWGIATEVLAGGHAPGDREAAFTAQRGARLVRNIIMAGENTYLQFRAVDTPAPGPAVWSRRVASITSFQPEQGGEAAHAIVGVRVAVGVEFNEYAPQVVPGGPLEFVAVDIHRTSDGLLVAEADFDLTL